MNGVLSVDKPAGLTSFDVVARLRRIYRERRVGHAGTLDPMATGVLVCCLGEATKLVPFLMEADKTYCATLLLGITTDTDDADEGARILARADPERLRAVTPEQVVAALHAQRGTVLQRPPRVSALKVEGQRLYARARAGDEDLEAHLASKQRLVNIYDISVQEVALPQVTFTVRCGRGTYIRSIARDVGEALGTGGHLVALRRLRVGRFTVEESAQLVRLEEGRDALSGNFKIYSPAEALSHLPTVHLSGAEAARLRRGHQGAAQEVGRRLGPEAGNLAAALDPAGRLVAVLGRSGSSWRIERGFTGAET
ncbi:MAG: tRNA pseudouridine(55) synthase TruB [Myxococcales bacterium]|nr:tRNA pseudouridine(55) synthase TruB [Myxococcota bacterium]MDW8280066.1 tRNA pseudouridine(55) synthase TruB [Myxococcales bacterium]